MFLCIKNFANEALNFERLLTERLSSSSLHSLTGKYREIQGNPCNENREPAMRTGFPCNESRFFPVGIDLQGVPCKPYRVWVYSVVTNIFGLMAYSHAISS